MIIWQGWGVLVPIIPLAIWFLIPELLKLAMPDTTYTNYFKYISSFSILLGALALWFLGRKLNGGRGRTIVDEKTGEKMVLKPKHSLFFLKMEYWAIPVFLLFLLMIFT